jgi:hypothetical protein
MDELKYTTMIQDGYYDANPNPEYLIKSIAEQGYSLETALADLIDNAISANADSIEIITVIKDFKITLYLADNGNGMSEADLKNNMKFPSNSIDNIRDKKDLGRFGLGMKTASFSQTRKFTTISKKKGEEKFSAATWDVNYLKSCGEWRIIINNQSDINEKINDYFYLSSNQNVQFENYKPNTIIIWDGLYKFENNNEPQNLYNSFVNELDNTVTEHISMVFHRFIDSSQNPLKIKINNNILTSIDPFPENGSGIRALESKVKPFGSDVIKIQGFVLPVSATDNENPGIWTSHNKGLSEREGLYIYRGDRIIFYGGWNGLIKKQPHLKLGRLKIEVGNSNDNKLQLNVSKSNIVIPYEHKFALLRCLSDLDKQTKIEYGNKGLKKYSDKTKKDSTELLNKFYSTKGLKVEINLDFPLLKILTEELNPSQFSKLKMVLKTINNEINKIKHVHEEKEMIGIVEKDGVDLNEVIAVIEKLIKSGMNRQKICDSFLNGMGFRTNNLPDEIEQLFK